MSIGETLTEARRQTGLTIAQVSQRTRIRESIIRAIEQDDFSPCGGDFYARGHIRSIADVVGTDPAPLIREYDEAHPPAAMSAAEAFEPATPIKIREPRRSLPIGKIAIVLVVAGIGYLGYDLVSSHSGPDAGAKPPAPAVTVSPRSAPAATAAPTPSATRPVKPEAVIVLTAKEKCWVELKNSSGQQVFQGTILAGQTKTWRAKFKISMVIGNPPGINLTVNGKNVTPRTVRVVTLNINPAGQKQVTLAAPAGASGVTLGATSVGR